MKKTNLMIELRKLIKTWQQPSKAWPSSPSVARILLLILTGLVLASRFEETGPLNFLHHIGIGLVVAGTVSAVWQFHEMKNFFVELAVGVMVDSKYLSKLNHENLQDMRSKSIEAIFQHYIDNPHYEIGAFTTWIDRLLIEKLLPNQAQGSGIYRTDFHECVAIQFITLGEALRDFGIPITPEMKDLELRLIKQTTVTTFRIIAPRCDKETFPAKMEGWAADIPDFPISRRVRYRIGSSQEDAEIIDAHLKNDPRGGITYSGMRNLKFKDGVCDVWGELIEYRSAESESWIYNTFNMLTHRLDAHIYVVNSPDELTFEGNVSGGLGIQPSQKVYLPKWNGLPVRWLAA